MLKKRDYVRLMIISKKINPKNINDEEVVLQKLNFYGYLI